MRLSNMSTKFVFVVLMLFLFSSLYASETRVATMGGGGIFVKDQSTVFLFPGTIHQYPDLVVAEMRARNADAIYSIGMHMDYGNMTSALYINQPINSLALATGQGDVLTGATAPINNAFVYMLGMELAGFDAGFGFIGASTSFENNADPKGEETASYMGILAGISNDVMDLGLLLELPSVESKNVGGDSEYGGFALQANGRYNLMKRNGFNIFPVASVLFGSTETKDVAEYSLFGIALGVGVEKQINEDNLFIVGLEASRVSLGTNFLGGADFEATQIISTLPGIYVGIESRIASWLIGRVGATQVNQQVTVESDPEAPGDNTTTSSQFTIALGLGMEFGNFLIDFNMNEATLFDGIYIFDGVGGGTQFATTVSITYNFGGGDDE